MFRSCRAAFCALLMAITFSLAMVSSAGAQGSGGLNCQDFSSQAAAQANLDANPSDPNGLDGNDDGQACENFVYADGSGTGAAPVADAPSDAVAEGDTDGDGSGDLDCADFASQEAAQAEFDADPSDPNGLDRDDDAYACEVFFGYIGNPVAGQPDIGGSLDAVAVSDLPGTGTGTTSTASTGSVALMVSAFSLVTLAAALLVSRRRIA